MGTLNLFLSPYLYLSSDAYAKKFLVRTMIRNMTFSEKRQLIWLMQEALAAMENEEEKIVFSQLPMFVLRERVYRVVLLSGYVVKDYAITIK